MKSLASLTFYGGVDEIGGNKILLKDGDTKVMLDFGVSFSLKRKFYSEPFLSPRKEKNLIEFGLLPRIKGIYEFEDDEPDLDGVLLTHSHMDHAAYVSFLKRKIPIYCGETSLIILQALNDMKLSSQEYNYDGLNFKTFRTGQKIKVGSLDVEPVHVDHSIPGSYGFIIHSSEGPLIYTGDFRMHGTRSEMSGEFIDKAADVKPLIAITEATNLVGVELSSEAEVKSKLDSVVKATQGLVLGYFASIDVDRLRSFIEVAEENKRYLALTFRQAYILDKLSRDGKLNVPSLKDESLLICRKAKKTYFKWEKSLLNLNCVVDAHRISEMQRKVILVLPFSNLEELVDISPQPGSCYLSSSSEPVNEEAEIDLEKLANWLHHYGLPQYRIHVSGHIMPHQLREAVIKMKPKLVYPIHCEKPELFSRFMGAAESKTILVEKEKEYPVQKPVV